MGMLTTKVRFQFYLDMVGSFLFAPFRWVGEWIERRRQQVFSQQLALARVQADAQKEMFVSMMSSMETMVKEMGTTSREQSAILQEWLKGFRTVEMPSTSVVRDSDEVEAERMRLMAEQGFPAGADATTQAQWLFEKMGED